MVKKHMGILCVFHYFRDFTCGMFIANVSFFSKQLYRHVACEACTWT